MFKIKCFLSVLFIFLLSDNLLAADLTVRVMSAYKGPNEAIHKIEWEIEKKSDGIYFKDVSANKHIVLKTDESGSPFDVDLSSQNLKATKGRQVSGKGKQAKKQLVFISDGHPAPFDWLDPDDMTDSEVYVSKNAGGTAFMSKMYKTVSLISPEDAKKNGYLNDYNLSFFNPDKPLYLIILKKNENVSVMQLWQADASNWLYESSGDRTSYRTGE